MLCRDDSLQRIAASFVYSLKDEMTKYRQAAHTWSTRRLKVIEFSTRNEMINAKSAKTPYHNNRRTLKPSRESSCVKNIKAVPPVGLTYKHIYAQEQARAIAPHELTYVSNKVIICL